MPENNIITISEMNGESHEISIKDFSSFKESLEGAGLATHQFVCSVNGQETYFYPQVVIVKINYVTFMNH